MGHRIISQKRGRGSTTWRRPSYKFKGKITLCKETEKQINGRIIDFVNCSGHSAPLATIKYDDGQKILIAAPEGVRIGDIVQAGEKTEIKSGNITKLKNIPEGTSVYSLELQPGDGGKFCRASGMFARIVGKSGNKVLIKLPSKREKQFHEDCRACIGVIAGSGRFEKPFLKAGNRFKAMKSRGIKYPITSAGKMNAVSHPFGNTRSLRKSKARPASRHAPPGRKVGMIAASRTGRKKRK
ncbi:50S ribosomal protein L2 [Candidatus Woesearchaeota archaeon]|nr:50S ribosomal protein L2 [Candidatus Woesearchaeota archaeon]